MRLFLYSMSRSPVQILATLFDTGRCRRREGGYINPHYRRSPLPRVSKALGDDPKTLGESFPECNTRGRGSRGRGLPQVPKLVHSEKPFPSVMLPLGDDLTPSAPSPVFFLNLFPECNTRGRNSFFFGKPLPRVLMTRHSGKPSLFF
jgi:hypothetical protein